MEGKTAAAGGLGSPYGGAGCPARGRLRGYRSHGAALAYPLRSLSVSLIG